MVKKRGLGKSLDALLTGAGVSVLSADAEMDEQEGKGERRERLAELPLDLIQPGRCQPRRDMDPETLQELANSIRAQGVIQPIVVRKAPGGRYEIVAGERRFRASGMAGRKTIPAIVRDIPDEATVAIALIENIQREDLNPVEEAMALQRLLEEFSMTHQQVADAVGKSRVTITNLLRLLSLPEGVLRLLERGDIEMGHARSLLTLPVSLQHEVAGLVVEKRLSVRETENEVRRLQEGSPSPRSAHKKTVDPDIRRLQAEISSRLGLGVKIACNEKGRGRVVIQYKNLDELESILGWFQPVPA